MRRLALAILLALAAPAAADAAPRLVKVDDFAAPIALGAAPGDPSRVYVVEREGSVRIVKDGVTLPAPFADLRSVVVAGGEQGLLGIAFPPDYATTGLLYVYLTARTPNGQYQVRELQRSADPDRAVAGPGRIALAVDDQNQGNHNGGQLAFGPDGLLYVAIGDGGSQNDPEGDAADTADLRGKILRIDPRPQGGGSHGVPADNPFGNEVWAYGLRNPWRFSFDRVTGTLVAADVGQNLREEIDVIVRGGNYGWRCWEGSILTPSVPGDTGSAPLCPGAEPQQPPDHEVSHPPFCSITGGFVVRDAGLPTLAGRYLFGDYCTGQVRSIVLGAGDERTHPALQVAHLTSFGEDACGRLLAVSEDGPLYRLVDGAPSPCVPVPGAPEPGTPAPGAGAADRTPCALRVRRETPRARRIALRLTASEPCTVTLRVRGYVTRTVTLAATTPRAVRILPKRAALRRLRRTDRRVRRTVRITAVDAAGNVSALTPRITIKRASSSTRPSRRDRR